MTTSHCNAKNPATCRYHGKPIQKLEKMLYKAKTSSDYLHIKSLIEEQRLQLFLDALPQKELATGFDETQLKVEINDTKKDNFNPLEDWTDLWVSDENGTPIGYAKVHVYSEEKEPGKVTKVSLCDIEINPKFSGRNAALSTLRKMKDLYNVPHIESGGTFSEQGHSMYKRLRGHELATGETVLKLDKYTAPKEPEIEGHHKSYSFVLDWDKRKPKFRL